MMPHDTYALDRAAGYQYHQHADNNSQRRPEPSAGLADERGEGSRPQV
jgi:hypothetical protein